MGTIIKCKLTLNESALGMSPADEDIYKSYISSNAPDAATLPEEIEALGADAVVEKGRTIFPRLPDGTPFLYDYQMKGFFKDACSMLSRLTGKDENGKKKAAVNESGKLKAYKKVIDGMIFVKPRKIPFELSGEVGNCSRPLRTSGPSGERVALASSDEVPAGSTLTFYVFCLDSAHAAAVREWLDYGELRGLGQWRNSGKGRFTYEELDSDAKTWKEVPV